MIRLCWVAELDLKQFSLIFLRFPQMELVRVLEHIDDILGVVFWEESMFLLIIPALILFVMNWFPLSAINCFVLATQN